MEAPERSPVWIIVMLTMILVELAWRLGRGRGYDRRSAFATLGLIAGNIPFAILNAVVLGGLFAAVSHVAPIHLPTRDWRTWLAAFIAMEFAYYGFHRASHRIRWLWATHATHHSSEQLTLLASFRLGWTNLFSAGWIFYVPLLLVGFDPRLIFGLLAFNLHYQFFLHTEAVGRLGPIEWLFNTPSHHRLHHAANDCYLDRNYGGVLIIFDRMFGTFAADQAGEAPRYGLAHRAATDNPLRLAFREWRYMFEEAFRASSPRAVARALIGPPISEI